MLLLTPALVTSAQDGPPPAPPPKPVARKLPPKAPAPVGKGDPLSAPKHDPSWIWSKTKGRVRVRTIKMQLGDLDALYAARDAERFRRRAACLLAAADEIDKAAKGLDRAPKDKRDDALDGVDDALALASDCQFEPYPTGVDEPPEGRVRISNASVSGPCADEQPDCGKAFGHSTWSKLLHDNQDELRYCYQQELGVRPRLKGVTRFELRLGAGENAGAVEKLRIVKNTVDRVSMLDCHAQILRALPFPEAADGRTLRFTLQHSSVKPKKTKP
jgi:hypothetical protein